MLVILELYMLHMNQLHLNMLQFNCYLKDHNNILDNELSKQFKNQQMLLQIPSFYQLYFRNLMYQMDPQLIHLLYNLNHFILQHLLNQLEQQIKFQHLLMSLYIHRLIQKQNLILHMHLDMFEHNFMNQELILLLLLIMHR